MTLYLSAIATIISISGFVIAYRNFRRSQRLEFLQRRDQLLLKISDLNAKMSEAALISARFDIVHINKTSSPIVDDKHSEELKTQVARIKELHRRLEAEATQWEQTIRQLHSICSRLTMKTKPVVIEDLIANVQIATHEIVRTNGVYLASLHTLETTDPMIRASLERMHDLKMQQAESNLEELKKAIDRNSPAPE